jgi:hypothetical protein
MSPDGIRRGKKFATEDVIVKAMTFVSIYRCCPVCLHQSMAWPLLGAVA